MLEQLFSFRYSVDKLVEENNMKKDDAIFNTLRETITSIKDIFYATEKQKEKTESLAKKKGLSNNRTTPETLPAYVKDSSIKLFENLEIFSKNELLTRYQIDLEEYSSSIEIESRTLGDLAQNHIIPTAIKYQNVLIKNVKGIKDIYGDSFKKYASEQILILERISNHIAEISSGISKMVESRKKVNSIKDPYKRALDYCDTILPFLTSIRFHCDKLELTVDDEIWPLAKYRELLFIR
jgi:glutamine synthetase